MVWDRKGMAGMVRDRKGMAGMVRGIYIGVGQCKNQQESLSKTLPTS